MPQSSPPILPVRGVHLDLKGLPPRPERLDRLLTLFAQMRFNAVLIEWEGMFPWRLDRGMRTEGCYTRAQVDRVHARCRELGLRVIPLVQSLGHLEMLLGLDRFAGLREVPGGADCLHPLHPDAADTVLALVREVVDATPSLTHFHLGGDEAWELGTHPDSAAFVAERGAAALYLRHYEPLLDWLAGRGIRPILWHDMMMDWPAEALQRIGQKADLMVWGYRGTPAQGRHHHRQEVLDRMDLPGVTLWGASAFKGADGTHRDLPDAAARVENNLGWAETAKKHDLAGVVATGWSRYWAPHVQVEPLDAALPELLRVAGILHDGEDPTEAGAEAFLRGCGEWGVVAPLRERLAAFESWCGQAWNTLRQAEEFLAGLELDPSRVRDGSVERIFKAVRGTLSQAEEAGAGIAPLLDPLVAASWGEHYAPARLDAIRNAYASLRGRAGHASAPADAAEPARTPGVAA